MEQEGGGGFSQDESLSFSPPSSLSPSPLYFLFKLSKGLY